MKGLVASFSCLVALSSLLLAPARSDEFPNRPIRLVVPYTTGAFPDTMARLFGHEMGRLLQQPFVIDNRQGGFGVVGSDLVARSAADGYTLLVNDVQLWAVGPALMKSLPFDAMRDFSPIGILGTTPLFLAMSANLPVEANLRELIALFKSSPGKYNYGTPGMGTIHHFATAALLAEAGVKVTHVPYKGGPALVQGLATGEVAIGFQALTTLPAFIQKGSVKVVAVATERRSAALPDVPTFAELGMENMLFPGSMGLLAPAGTPPAVIERLATAVAQAAQDGELRRKLATLGILPGGISSAEMKTMMKADSERYARVARVALMEGQ